MSYGVNRYSRSRQLDSYSLSSTSTLLHKSYNQQRSFSSSTPSYANYAPSIYGYPSDSYSSNNYSQQSSASLVRPSTRNRSVSRSRDSDTKTKSFTREQSLPRIVTQARTQYKDRNRPEFKTIRSSPKKPESRYLNGTDARRVVTSPLTSNLRNEVEVVRTINKAKTRLSPDTSSYVSSSPSTSSNRTSNNNTLLEDLRPSRPSSDSRRDSDTQRLTNGSSYSQSRFTSHNAGKVGLRNIGNTCFMNSILQCLSNTKPLRDYILDKRYSKDIKTSSQTRGKLVEAFADILDGLWYPSSSSSSAVSTTNFKAQIQKFSSRFSGYEQQDCQEFLRFLIEGLHEDVNKAIKHKSTMPNFDSLSEESKAEKTWKFYLSKDDSYIVDLFMGQLKSSLTCAECKHVSTTFDPFWDLSLPIPKYTSHGTRIDIKYCLETFTREETLEGDERPTCDKCKARRRMTKKFTIYRFPKILVIHLKRFNEGHRYRQKLSNDVAFPKKLEISSPISTSTTGFQLYAVSNHSGSCYGGHYTAYCKNPETEEWYSYNDSLVNPMTSSCVQSKEAYVLFYETLPARSHL